MNTTIFAAVIEDDEGVHHQFDAVSEDTLYEKLAEWVRPRWERPIAKQPKEADVAVNLYFAEQVTEVPNGFQHELWVLDPIELDAPDLNCSPFEAAATDETATRYPMEIIVNGELNFKYDSPDPEGDLRAIKALMKWRCRMRSGKPLTDLELYGKENPHEIIYRSPHGKLRVLDGLAPGILTPVTMPPKKERPFLTDPEAIADAIDEWHSDPAVAGEPVFKGGLHEVLGWTRNQYVKWVETGVTPTPDGDSQELNGGGE